MKGKSYLHSLFVIGIALATAFNSFGQSPGKAKWTSPVVTGDEVNGSPAMSPDGSTVYVTSKDGNLYAIDSASGQIKPNWPVQLSNVGSGGELISSPVVAADGAIYVASTHGTLYSLNPNGSQNWKLDIVGIFVDLAGASVALGFDGTIYLTYDDHFRLYAVNPTGNHGQGVVKWMFDLHTIFPGDTLIDSCPSVGPDGTVYFYYSVDDGSYLAAVGCDGIFKWSFPLGFQSEEFDDFQFTPVIDADGTVYVPYGPAADRLIAIRPDMSPKWPAFNTASGLPILDSPAIGPDGTLYFGTQNGTLFAVRSDGTQKWTYSTRGGGSINSSPAVAADGNIYFGCSDGRLYVVKDNGTSALTQWRYPAIVNPPLGPIVSSPVIGSDHAVYFGSADHNLYAVWGTSTLATSPWPMFRKNTSHTASQAAAACSSCCETMSVSFSEPADGTFVCWNDLTPGAITLTANVSGGCGNITHVDFFAGLFPIGSVSSAPWTLTWSPQCGSHTVVAIAYADSGCQRGGATGFVLECPPPPPFSAQATAGGLQHSLAVKSDQTVWSWGNNVRGQLGTGDTSPSSVPVPVASQMTAVSAGSYFSLALNNDSTVWAWGDNTYLQTGNPDIGSYSALPVPVKRSGQGPIQNITKISAGGSSGYALMNDHTVWAWGRNNRGQLGNGNTTDQGTAVQVSGLNNAIAIAAGLNHCVALKSDGTVVVWGDNTYGQLGNPAIGAYYPYPTTVVAFQPGGLNNVMAIAASANSGYALRTDGTVWVWGDNSTGQLGIGSTTSPAPPHAVQIPNLSNIASIAAGGWHCFALTTCGDLWGWGRDIDGEVGDGSPIPTLRLSPVLAASANSSGLQWIGIGAGTYHNIGIASSTSGGPLLLRSWGANAYGQLGNGTLETKTTPTPLANGFNP